MKKYQDMCPLERRIFRISEIVDLQRRLAQTKPIQAGCSEVGTVIKEDRSDYIINGNDANYGSRVIENQ